MPLVSGDVLARREVFWHEDYDGNVVIETRQDVEPLVDENKALHANVDERARHRDLNLYARIPITVWMELYRLGVAQDQKALKRWLNDPDNRVFRTRPGRM